MTTTSPPRKRGRPKKVVATPIDAAEAFNKAHNPDCEPATRGYVKCIARKLDCTLNMGRQYGPSACLWFLLSLIFGIGAVAVWIIGSHDTIYAIIAAVCCLIACHDGLLYCAVKSDQRSNLGYMGKYTPPTPVCEKRKECE